MIGVIMMFLFGCTPTKDDSGVEDSALA